MFLTTLFIASLSINRTCKNPNAGEVESFDETNLLQTRVQTTRQATVHVVAETVLKERQKHGWIQGSSNGTMQQFTWWMESCIHVGSIKFGLPGLTGQLLGLSPLGTMHRIVHEGTVGKLPLLPYSAMFVNGSIWALYGLLSANPTIWIPNLVGALLGAVYSIVFLSRCPPDANWLPHTRSVHLQGIASIWIGMIALALFLPTVTAKNVLGSVGTTACIVMFAGPLAALKTILEEKSNRSLPLGFTLAIFVNCLLWATYGYVYLQDPYISVPNGFGLFLSIVQLALYVRFSGALRACESRSEVYKEESDS